MDNQNRDTNVGGDRQQEGGDLQSERERNKDWNPNQGGSQPGGNKPSQGSGNPSNPSQGGGRDFDRGGSQGQGSGSGPNR
jgi:hypothetical protein